jgi:hypothetical protein
LEYHAQFTPVDISLFQPGEVFIQHDGGKLYVLSLDKLDGFLEIKGAIAESSIRIGPGVWLFCGESFRDTGDCALEALHASWVKEICIDARPADVGGFGGSWRRTRRVGGRVDGTLG